MTAPWYVPSGAPSTGAFAASAVMRSEFDSIGDGFDLLPALSAGVASRAVVIASNGLSLTVTTGTLALAGNFATTGAFNTTFVQGATVSLTLPIVSGLTLATLTGTETLTNKTITSPSIGGTVSGAATYSSVTLVTPALGTPTSGVLTNCTGYPTSSLSGSISLTTQVTGVLPTANGGTNLSSFTSGGAVYASSTSVLTTGTLPVASGGTGITSFGTGVATALGINVGSAGAPVINGGALGTPSSGTLTNATGLPLTTGVTGTLPATNGGTAQSTYATGDTLYASALNTLSKLTIGSSGQVLTVAAGVPSWAALSSSAVTTFSAGTTGLTPSSATSGAITLAGTLAVANGGTGVTSSTGTGSVVLSASPTFTGTLTAAIVNATTGYQIGGTTFATNDGTYSILHGGAGSAGAYLALTNNYYDSAVHNFRAANHSTALATLSASGLTLPNALNYGGVTLSNSVTGTGSMVLSASPTLTGTLTAATANFSGQVGFTYNGDTQTLYKNGGGTTVAYVGTTGAFGGITTDALRFRSDVGEMAWGFTGAVYMKLTTSLLTLTSALNYGGVTLSNSVTGTGSMVLSASPTFTGTLTAATIVGSSVTAAGVGAIVRSYDTTAAHVGLYLSSASGVAYLNTTNNAGAYTGTSMSFTTAATSISTALTYGGVTLANSVTGTGSMVLSASPTFTGTLSGAAASFTGNMGSQTLTVNHGATVSTSTVAFTNTGAAGINIAMYGDGATTPNKFIRVNAGLFQLVNSGYTAVIFGVTDAGNATIYGTAEIGGTLRYGGVTLSSSVTGTGSMVLSASPTFTGTGVTINNGTTARLLVGTTNADAMFEVYSPNGSVTACPIIAHDGVTSGGLQFAQFRYGAGSGTVVGSITGNTSGTTAYNTSSDIRLKTNFAPATSASKIIDAIAVEEFDWKSSGERQRYGMVAQRLVEVYPEAVWQGTKDGDMWAVDYSKLVPVMVKEIQELRSRVKALEA